MSFNLQGDLFKNLDYFGIGMVPAFPPRHRSGVFDSITFNALSIWQRAQMRTWIEEQEIDIRSCEAIEFASDGEHVAVRFMMLRRVLLITRTPPDEPSVRTNIERYAIDVLQPTRPCPWPFG